MAILATTELEVVNKMLSCIMEAPVNSLNDSGLGDVALAKSILADVSREVQTLGWHWNTEKKYLLVRDVSNFIQLPSNTLQVDTVYPNADVNVAVRGSRLYDVVNHTYVFTKDLYVDLTVALDFTDLPQVARQYISIMACRQFMSRTIGSAELVGLSQEDEAKSLYSLRRHENQNADYNILTGTSGVYNIVARRGARI